MKKILFYAMCVAALATAACSDDDNGPKVRIETNSGMRSENASVVPIPA